MGDPSAIPCFRLPTSSDLDKGFVRPQMKQPYESEIYRLARSAYRERLGRRG